MAVWCWRAAFSIVLSLNAAHAIANSAESSGAYLAEYCSGIEFLPTRYGEPERASLNTRGGPRT
jgi:hypothetical protein